MKSDAKGDNGNAPLYKAVLNNELDAAKRLLSAGADVNSQTKDGWTPLHLAALKNAPKMAKLRLPKARMSMRKGNTATRLWIGQFLKNTAQCSPSSISTADGSESEPANRVKIALYGLEIVQRGNTPSPEPIQPRLPPTLRI